LTSDEDYDVSVRHIRRLAQGMALYECRWFNPEFLGKRCYRFVIEARMEGDKLYSEIFGGNILVDGM
jgi:predicted DCC family thiol-disulfide oxidoreductase YuxK